MILFPYAGDTRGGSVHSSFLLIEELLRRRRDLILAFHGNGFARDLARQRRFPYIDLPALGTLSESARKDRFRLGNLTAVLACRQVLARHGIKLVHVNDKRMLRTWCVPTRATGRFLLAHWRSVYWPSWSVDMGLRLTSSIVCVSVYSYDRLPHWAKAKSEVVYNPFRPGVETEKRDEVRRRTRESAGIPHNAAVIGYFGALLDRKRPHILLKLLKRLTSTLDGRPIYGVVCGEPLEPRDELYFRMIGAEDWQGRIIEAGFVSNVTDWMAACDVLIAPAIDEPLARVGVEAQSVGLPAIVSSDGGLREVVEDGVSGFVLDPGDFEAWVSHVRRVLDDVDLGRTLSEGGLRAAAKLTVERHADAMDAIYDRLLPQRPPDPTPIVVPPGLSGDPAQPVSPPFSESR